MFNKRTILIILIISISTTAWALRIGRPPTLSYPLTADQVAQLNKFMEDSYNIQNGRSELDVVTSTKSNAKNGEFWIIDTGVNACIQFKSNGSVGNACGSGGGSSSTSPGGTDGQLQYNNGGSFGGANIAFWDDSNGRLGIGTSAPNEQLEITKNFRLPESTTTAGNVYKNGNLFLHNYGSSLDGTDENTFLGEYCGNISNTAIEVTAVGNLSMQNVTSARRSSSFGYKALQSLTTGNDNAAFGETSLGNLTTGIENSSFGAASLYALTTGGENSAFGRDSLGTLSTSSNLNTAIGFAAGANLINGDGNTFLGANAGKTGQSDVNNSTCVGTNCRVGRSHMLVLGDSTDASLNVGIGTSVPQYKLDINGTSNSTAIFKNGSALSLTGLSDVGSATITAGRLLVADGTKFQSVGMSGSCSLTSDGAISCTAGSGATNLTGLTDVGSATIAAGSVLIADGTKFQSKSISGDITVTSAGVTAIGSDKVGATQLSSLGTSGTYSAASITVDADGRVQNAFGSSLTGLSDIGSATITAGNLLIQDGTKFQSKALSGDITVTSAGVSSIGSDKVGSTQLSSTSVSAGTYGVTGLTIDSDGRIQNAFSLGLTGLSDVGSSTVGAGRLLINDGTKYQSVAMSGSCTITSAGAISCTGGSGATYLTGLADVGSATIAAGTLLIADGTKFQSKSMSGDVTITSAGVSAIGSDKVGSTQLSSTSVTAGTYGGITVDGDGRLQNAFAIGLTGLNDVGSSTVGAGRLLINDGTKFQSSTVTGDVTITSAGVTAVGADKIGSSQLSSTTVTAGTYGAASLTVDGDGRITNAFSTGLTGLNDVGSSTVGAGRLLINDGTKFQSVAATGDVTINSAGVTAIGADKVGSSQLSSTTVTAGTYGAASLTVDADGRITNAFSTGLTGLSDVGSATVTAGNILIQDGTKFQSKALSQHCFITSSGQVNCNAGGWAKSLTGLSDVGTATITAGNLLVADGTNFKSVAVSGDVFMTSSGRIASNTFAKQLTGLSDVGSATITAGNILIQDGTKFQSKAMSGDVTMTSAGVTTSTSGLQFLGSKVLGSAAATTGALTVAAKDVIVIYIRITGYAGGGDIASLRFNADSGANYWDRHITWAAGGTTATNTQTASTTLVRLARAAATTGRMIEVTISNLSSVSKSITIYTQTGTGAAATVGVIDTGGGEWVNTSAQITSIELLTAGGANMNANSGFAVFGKNL